MDCNNFCHLCSSYSGSNWSNRKCWLHKCKQCQSYWELFEQVVALRTYWYAVCVSAVWEVVKMSVCSIQSDDTAMLAVGSRDFEATLKVIEVLLLQVN